MLVAAITVALYALAARLTYRRLARTVKAPQTFSGCGALSKADCVCGHVWWNSYVTRAHRSDLHQAVFFACVWPISYLFQATVIDSLGRALEQRWTRQYQERSVGLAGGRGAPRRSSANLA